MKPYTGHSDKANISAHKDRGQHGNTNAQRFAKALSKKSSQIQGLLLNTTPACISMVDRYDDYRKLFDAAIDIIIQQTPGCDDRALLSSDLKSELALSFNSIDQCLYINCICCDNELLEYMAAQSDELQSRIFKITADYCIYITLENQLDNTKKYHIDFNLSDRSYKKYWVYGT